MIMNDLILCTKFKGINLKNYTKNINIIHIVHWMNYFISTPRGICPIFNKFKQLEFVPNNYSNILNANQNFGNSIFTLSEYQYLG
jgi:hypothetical protein